MKPLPFDLTPLAKALDVPASTMKHSNKQPPAPRGETRPSATASPAATATESDKKTRKAKTASRSPARPAGEAPRSDAGKPAAPATREPEAKDGRHVLPRHLAASRGWISTLAQEQVHALATHVLARHAEQGLRVLAITSALAGEGKTTVSLALAEKLASAGKRVLIVDLDTHRGTLSQEAGLSDLAGALESSSSDSAAFHAYETDCKGVTLMPTGRIDYSAAGSIPLLSPERIRILTQRGLEDHDIVVLDCPPLMPVADTHVIAETADNAILVVRAGATPREVLEQAINEFGKEKFFAVILNRAQPHHIPYFNEVYGYYRRDPT